MANITHIKRPRTVHLVAAVLLAAEHPMSMRQIAQQAGRPVRSVSNTILRLRRAGLVELVTTIKPLCSRTVGLYVWKTEV